jgi:hypothetical protein
VIIKKLLLYTKQIILYFLHMTLESRNGKNSEKTKNTGIGAVPVCPDNGSQKQAVQNRKRVEDWNNGHRPIRTSINQKGS